MDLKTMHEAVTIQNPPKPQKVWFYISKTHVFEDAPYPEKVTKMGPKWSPSGPQIDPKAPKRPPKASQKTRRKQMKKKIRKRPQKKPG